MPFTRNGDIRIYYETVGSGPPLLLQQGFACVTEGWYQLGYVDALQDQFTLILMDQRGVGRSDRPTDPDAYTAELRVGDLTVVLDACGIKTAHYMAYSQGGMTGWHACRHAPERFRSLILGAATPSFGGIDGKPNPMGKQLGQVEMDNWIASLASIFGHRWNADVESLFRDQSLSALSAARAFHRDPELLPDMLTVPVLSYADDADHPCHDKCRAFCEQTPLAQFVSLPGMDHVEGFYALDEMVPRIIAFIDKIESGLALETA